MLQKFVDATHVTSCAKGCESRNCGLGRSCRAPLFEKRRARQRRHDSALPEQTKVVLVPLYRELQSGIQIVLGFISQKSASLLKGWHPDGNVGKWRFTESH